MVNRFVPEADALDQQLDAAPAEADSVQEDDGPGRSPAFERPAKMPLEAPESDVLEQSQTVDLDDEWR